MRDGKAREDGFKHKLRMAGACGSSSGSDAGLQRERKAPHQKNMGRGLLGVLLFCADAPG